MKSELHCLSALLVLLLLAYSDPLRSQAHSSFSGVGPEEARQRQEDLRFMAEEMPTRHKNLFHTMTREQFQQAVERLSSRIPSLARHQIIVEMAKIVAMVGDGHTNIAPTRDPKIGFRTYPLKLYFFKEGLYVRAATEPSAGRCFSVSSSRPR